MRRSGKPSPSTKTGKNCRFGETTDTASISIMTSTSNLRLPTILPKKITGLTVSVNASMDSLIQIGEDGNIIDFPGKAPIALGDLQPRRKLVVNLLASSLLTYATSTIKKAIVFSSDEHVRIAYRFPPPEHIEHRQRERRRFAYLLLWIVFSGCVGAIVIILGDLAKH